ncbi:unnamed protein product [Prorocentrum cordatum]|uniref:Band 7 domain-containing protein n=1 Tax=Prorocentrum cordatum TaxID=2364126 RepID=A0ABN9T3A1_9DINO|nr:unnamed protein product [Polarella glacialis]
MMLDVLIAVAVSDDDSGGVGMRGQALPRRLLAYAQQPIATAHPQLPRRPDHRGADEAMAGQQRQESGCIPCCNCCVTVPQDKIYAVENFGSFTKARRGALGGKRVEQNEVFVETKTKDNVFVMVKVSVQQQVIPEQAESSIYKLANVSAQIDSYVADVVRSSVPRMTLDEAFEEKDKISAAVSDTLTKSMHEYGFQIIKALVTELKPSQDVMNSIQLPAAHPAIAPVQQRSMKEIQSKTLVHFLLVLLRASRAPFRYVLDSFGGW